MVQEGDCKIISRLPIEWQGLMKQLLMSLEKGNIWFIEETSSKYGSQPVWYKLLQALIKCEPCIVEDKLVFKPRFLLLPEMLQERLLEFLQYQSYLMPDQDIKEFIIGLIKHTDVHSNLYQQLHCLFRETKLEEDLFTEVETVLKPGAVDTCPEKAESPKQEMIEIGSQESVIILDDEDDGEPAQKRQKTTEESSELQEEDNGQTVSMETSDERHTSTNVLENDDKHIDKSSLKVIDGKEALVYKIKEIWQNCIHDQAIEGLSEISKLSLKEIEVFCKMIDFDSMSDDSIELVCQHLSGVSDSLSYSSAVCILTFVLGHRILQLSQNASRKLLGAITVVSQNFPKQTVESVLVPCMMQDEVPSFQIEILCKTLKDCLSATTRGYFIQKVLQNNFILTEHKITILQTVVDSGCDLSYNVFSSLLQCLNDASISMAKNLKFGKLLFALVNKHSKLFNQDLTMKAEQILDKHNTFLKKSIQSSLNKLKFV